MSLQKYSVLMSVYAKEKPEFLRESMMSMYEQTVPTDDFVLICDGPLNEGIDSVIDEMSRLFGGRLRVFRFSENRGLGYALGFGVEKCKNELIARMDSDDVSVRDRCEKELRAFEREPNLSVVGSYVAEFKDDIEKMNSIRKVPEKNKEILVFAKMRNPINHPSAMMKKKDVLTVGGYKNVKFCQDYYLWTDLLANGYRCYNIQEVLVYMREDANTFKRRSGKKYFKIQKDLISKMRKQGLLTIPQYYKTVSVRFCSAFMPNWCRQSLFKKFMREGVK